MVINIVLINDFFLLKQLNKFTFDVIINQNYITN
jgi:hypothetical protein